MQLQQGFATDEMGVGVSLHDSNPKPPMSALGLGRVKTFCRAGQSVETKYFPDFGYALIAAISG
jgi:hypothetical protein